MCVYRCVDMNSLLLLISGRAPRAHSRHVCCSRGRSWYIKQDNTVTQLYSPTIHITGHNGKYQNKRVKVQI